MAGVRGAVRGRARGHRGRRRAARADVAGSREPRGAAHPPPQRSRAPRPGRLHNPLARPSQPDRPAPRARARARRAAAARERPRGAPRHADRRRQGAAGRHRGALMPFTYRTRVAAMLADASARHEQMLPELPPVVRASLPVDAQGITEAIDFLGEAAGLATAERRSLVRPHGVNPAVMHARVFGGTTPLGEGTVMGAFVEGARVRAGVLVELAEAIGGAALSAEVQELL